MKLELTTLSDFGYLPKGLALYESLLKFDSDFSLNYLCLDDESYAKLSELNLEKLVPVHVDSIIQNDDVAKFLRKENRWLFCMSMASYFTKHIMDKGAESVTYIDSDVYFHRSINEMTDEFESREIAIFRHRQFPLDKPRPEGWFNVGVVFFRNSKFGKRVLNWWSDAVINQKFPELATCGDQKYLDKFIDLCPEELLYIDGNIGHGAPWQWQLLEMSEKEGKPCVTFEGNEQKYFFSHFSQFQYDVKSNTYVPSTMHHIYTSQSMYESKEWLKKLYEEYYNLIKTIYKKYGF